jgi:hypothetical protein
MIRTSLLQRINPEKLFAVRKQFPIRFQIVVVYDYPGFEQLHFCLGNSALQNFSIERDDNLFTGLFRVNMRALVPSGAFHVHPYYNPVKQR